jgi:hypothetical protein
MILFFSFHGGVRGSGFGNEGALNARFLSLRQIVREIGSLFEWIDRNGFCEVGISPLILLLIG